MSADPALLPAAAERRKQVRLSVRADLIHTPQKYEGRACHVVKDPVGLKYYRFNEQEYFVLMLLDGKNTLEDVQKEFEKKFRPHRLTLEDLEAFARQLVTSGLVQHESPNAGKHVYDRRVKQRRLRKIAQISNILYLKIPVFDPDRVLGWMHKRLFWIFTRWFLAVSVGVMLAAALLVTLKFQVFWDKLPAYHEFFQFRTLLYMWIALGVVKVIHEFGHGLSCKAFGGECHEMGALLMCFSPALYCNVSDSWTLPDKWKRIIISFAGIYVELIIAALATFVWWYTPHWPVINNISLCLMVLCSVSTFVFNANPLMRFDGYYILADWLEIPNLRDRCNRYLGNLVSEKCLGVETQPEPYMAPGRKVLFLVYAIASYIYRWVVTFTILWFLANWLKPYKLENLSLLLAVAAGGSMVFWPLYRLGRNLKQRGRLPDMKKQRVMVSMAVLASLVAAFFLLPLPVGRVRETGLVQVQESNLSRVYVTDPAILESLEVEDGQWVAQNQLLARLSNPKLEFELAEAVAKREMYAGQIRAIEENRAKMPEDPTGKVKTQLLDDLIAAQNGFHSASGAEAQLRDRLSRLKEIKAPREGVVMTPPKREEMFKLWEKGQGTPFCSVGDPKRLVVKLPVSPPDYRMLRENLDDLGSLEVSILVPGRTDKIFTGKVLSLPETDEKNVPVQLTHRGGGSLAVKPSQNPNVNQPISQTYLVVVEVVDPDDTIHPGTLVQAKIHCRWHSAAWWVGRAIASALDWGLL